MAHLNQAIQALEAALPSHITLPSHPSYPSLTIIPWSQTCHTAPAAFIHPTSATEVSAAFRIIKQHKVKFAVRATGHNPNEGFSSTDEQGVVLDLSELRSMEMVGEEEVKVGAGCKWGNVYGFVEGRGRGVVGGRDTEVGVGGFLLGGGLGAFPNLYGLGTDNIKAIEIITADGSITQANSYQNNSLFQALKGGGSNFGIVTSFTLATHPSLHVTWTIALYNAVDAAAIHRATLAVQDAMEEDEKIGCFTNFNQGFVAVGLLYAEDEEVVRKMGSTVREVKAFKGFDGLERMMTVANGQTGSLGDLAKAMSHKPKEKKRYVGTLTTEPDESFYSEVFELWENALKTIPEGGVLHYTIQPVGARAAKYAQEQGGNTMNVQARSQVWWVFTAEWPSTADDTTTKAAVDGLVDKATRKAKEKGVWLEHLCATFAGDKQSVLGSFGGEALERMRDVSREWDAEGVFQGLQNGGFLLRDCK